MAHEISLAATSGRVRAPSYEELYGRPGDKTTPAEATTRPSRFRAILLVGSLAVISMALIGQRERIVRRVPELGRAYAAIGLPVNTRGLAFRTVRTTLLEDSSQRVLGVEGQIANLRNVAIDVPDMRIAISSADGAEIYNSVAKSPKSRLGPGEEVYFRTRLNAPPERGEKVMVRFAEASVQPNVKPAPKK